MISSKIFINLPVKNLQSSIEFFTNLGFSFNPEFTDNTAACMIIGENIFSMLLTQEKFSEFTNRPIAIGNETTQVLIAIDQPTKKAVNELVDKAVKAGGSTYSAPKDHGWMYQHAFADLDGHQWEVLWMESK